MTVESSEERPQGDAPEERPAIGEPPVGEAPAGLDVASGGPADVASGAAPATAAPGSPWHVGGVSRETAAYLGLLAVALVARFWDLDARPLTPGEAALATAALDGTVPATGSPLPAIALRVWTALFGTSDIAVRSLPALLGALLVPAVWGLRPILGRRQALATAALFALAPLWVVGTREVTPLPFATLSFIIALGAIAAGRPTVAGIGAAAMLASGGATWGAILGGCLGLLGIIGAGQARVIRDGWRRLVPERAGARRLGVSFVVSLLIFSTGVLIEPGGFSALVAGPARWWQELQRASLGPVMGGALVFLVYAPVLTGFAVVGLIAASTRIRLAAWLLPWTMVAVTLALTVGSPSSVNQALLPLSIAAGVGLSAMFSRLVRGFRWDEDGVMIWIMLVVLGYALIHAWRYAEIGLLADTRSDWALMTGALAMAAVLLLAFAVLWGPDMVLRVGGATWLIVAGMMAWSNGARLGWGQHAELARPAQVLEGARLLASTAEQIVDGLGTGTADRPLRLADASLRDVLGWSLRDVEDLTWQNAPPEDDGPYEDIALIVAREGATSPPDDRYVASTFTVSATWTPGFMDRQGFLRWYLQRRLGDAGSGLPLVSQPNAVRATLFSTRGVAP